MHVCMIDYELWRNKGHHNSKNNTNAAKVAWWATGHYCFYYLVTFSPCLCSSSISQHPLKEITVIYAWNSCFFTSKNHAALSVLITEIDWMSSIPVINSEIWLKHHKTQKRHVTSPIPHCKRCQNQNNWNSPFLFLLDRLPPCGLNFQGYCPK